jgi:hypothetical protein
MLQYAFSMHEGMGGGHEFVIVVDSNDAVESTTSLIVAAEYPKP